MTMIVKAAKLEVSRRLAKKKLEKLKNQKGGDPQDKTQCPVGRGRGQATRPARQVTRPPLNPYSHSYASSTGISTSGT